MGSGPTLVALFYPHLFKGPISKCSHMLGPLGLWLQHVDLGDTLGFWQCIPVIPQRRSVVEGMEEKQDIWSGHRRSGKRAMVLGDGPQLATSQGGALS